MDYLFKTVDSSNLTLPRLVWIFFSMLETAGLALVAGIYHKPASGAMQTLEWTIVCVMTILAIIDLVYLVLQLKDHSTFNHHAFTVDTMIISFAHAFSGMWRVVGVVEVIQFQDLLLDAFSQMIEELEQELGIPIVSLARYVAAIAAPYCIWVVVSRRVIDPIKEHWFPSRTEHPPIKQD